MNIIFWNCRGALSPSFHGVLSNLLNRHSPAIMVIMETRVAKAITDRLPFNGVIHADTIGYSKGIWVLELRYCGGYPACQDRTGDTCHS